MTRGNPIPNQGPTPPVPAAFAQIAGTPADQDVPVWSAADGYASWGSAGGGSQPGAARVLGPFPFAYNTPSLNNGVTVWTPAAGDILLDAWIEIDTAFDGTTPFGDFGTFVGGNDGFLSWGAIGVVDVSNAFGATVWAPSGTLAQSGDAAGFGASISSQVLGSMGGNHAASAALPFKLTAADPIKVVVSQTGAKGGTAVGGTAGAGSVYLVIATPSLT